MRQEKSCLAANEATVGSRRKTYEENLATFWHCIDYVITKKERCLVVVMRVADCNSDHRLLRAKIIIYWKKYFG